MISGCVLMNAVAYQPVPKKVSGGVLMNPVAYQSVPKKLPFTRFNCLPKTPSLRLSSVSCSSRCVGKVPSPRLSSDLRFLSTSASSFLSGDLNGLTRSINAVPKRQRTSTTPRASKDVPFTYRYPPMTKKPRWWWRSVACLPYLLPLHETWVFAETAYNLHPFLEDLEFLTYPFLGAMGRLPSWFLLAYFIVGYLGVVRKREWPHFFRFHLVMGMLLEILLQVVGAISRWLPRGIYWGKIGMHVWTALAFGFLFTVLECIRCCLAGMYADVPFVADAAYMQIPYD